MPAACKLGYVGGLRRTRGRAVDPGREDQRPLANLRGLRLGMELMGVGHTRRRTWTLLGGRGSKCACSQGPVLRGEATLCDRPRRPCSLECRTRWGLRRTSGTSPMLCSGRQDWVWVVELRGHLRSLRSYGRPHAVLRVPEVRTGQDHGLSTKRSSRTDLPVGAWLLAQPVDGRLGR